MHNRSEEKIIKEFARKPILGFSTWSTQLLDNVNGYGGKTVTPWFNEERILNVSNVMKQKLPRYEYINLDSGWSNSFDEYGRWMYRQDLFPNGLQQLSKKIQKNGHKLGIYILPGIPKPAADNNLPIKGTQHTLGEYITRGQQGNIFKDTTYMPDKYDDIIQQYFNSMAELFSEWGIQYVKIDGCGPGSGDQIYPYLAPDCRTTLQIMFNAFTKYDIWVELSWYLDANLVEEWAFMANGARIYIDIESYSTRTMTTSSRVIDRMHFARKWSQYQHVIGSHNGFYIDLDAVLVGMTTPWNGRCIDGLDNDMIRKTYISFWALMSSVFCIGADPCLLPDKYIQMLHHPTILDIQQSGNLANPLPFNDFWENHQVWWKPFYLNDDSNNNNNSFVICVGLFNTYLYPIHLQNIKNNNNNNYKIKHQQINWMKSDVSFKFKDVWDGSISKAQIIDVWTNQVLGIFENSYTAYLEPGECQLVFLKPL